VRTVCEEGTQVCESDPASEGCLRIPTLQPPPPAAMAGVCSGPSTSLVSSLGRRSAGLSGAMLGSTVGTALAGRPRPPLLGRRSSAELAETIVAAIYSQMGLLWFAIFHDYTIPMSNMCDLS
jgi:hypothetical protein